MNPRPWEPYANMHVLQLSALLFPQIPSETLPATQGWLPLPCKRPWRDPRASSMLLLMPEMIMPPRLGPMSADIGETVSVMGPLRPWDLQGNCQNHQPHLQDPMPHLLPRWGQKGHPHPATTCITLPREEPEWGKAAAGAEQEPGGAPKPAPIRHPHENHPADSQGQQPSAWQ